MSMPNNVILVNRTKRPRRMLVLNLTKQIAPVKVTNRTTEETRQGTRRKRVSSKLVADSIRIPANGESAPLDHKVLGAPEVKAAITRRDIAVKRAPTLAEVKGAADAAMAQKARSEAWAKKKAAAAQVPLAGPKPRKKRNGNGGEA